MKKTITSVLAAATIAVALAGSVTDASAQRRGGAVAAGILGGFVAGAIVGSAVANSQPAYVAPAYPAYAVQPGYVVYGGYAAGAPVGCPGGYWARQPKAYDRWGNVIAWSRPRFFCP
jgi:hypothetical protein